MYFLSVRKSPTIVLEQTRTIWHKTDKGEAPEYTPRVAVTFQGLSEPIPCEGLPGRKGSSGRSVAQGILSVEDAVRQSGLAKSDLVSRLVKHKNHGSEFIYVNSEGKLANYDPEEARVSSTENPLYESLVAVGDGRFHCEACDTYCKNEAAAKAHARASRAHPLMLKSWKEDKTQTLQEAV